MALNSKNTFPLLKFADFQSIQEITLPVCAELDRRTISFRALLDLGVDSLLPLSRPTGENIDIYAGEVLIGSGEILVVDSNLAIRFADLCDRPSEAAKGAEPLALVAPSEVQASS